MNETTGGVRASANRYARLVQWVSLALIVGSVLLIFRKLPLAALAPVLQNWIGSLGYWGPVVFAILYIGAVVLMLPASPMTLAAGAIFGLAAGMAITSVASTIGAALAFLIARHLARATVEKKVKGSPKLSAIDKAVGDGGWKIVAMLRLSPAVPFNLQNYLYGVTRIRFWVCILTSWIAMLPGTFLYVYLGHASLAGLESTSGAGRARTPGEWTLLGVGFLATIAVTVYVTYSARKALKERTEGTSSPDQGESKADEPATPKGWPWRATITVGVALALMGVAAVAQFDPGFEEWFAKLIPPPA